jgi:hypothetical protein
MLRECGISIAGEFMQVEGRVLQAPQVGRVFTECFFFEREAKSLPHRRMFFIAYCAGPV